MLTAVPESIFSVFASACRKFIGRRAKAQRHAASTWSRFKDLSIPLPPLPEQKRIVDKLDALREETQRLASLYERKLAALEALKKSLLHQAFTGKL